jgi:hypothetical protein
VIDPTPEPDRFSFLINEFKPSERDSAASTIRLRACSGDLLVLSHLPFAWPLPIPCGHVDCVNDERQYDDESDADEPRFVVLNL